MLSGHAPRVGASVSLTVTVKLQLFVLGGVAVSLAVQLTVVVPLAKIEPLAGVQTTVALPQLSVAVGGVKVTTAWHALAAVLCVMLSGHALMTGTAVSLTRNSWLQVLEHPFFVTWRVKVKD